MMDFLSRDTAFAPARPEEDISDRRPMPDWADRRIEACAMPSRIPLWKRLGWIVGIWTGSVLVLGVVTVAIKLWLAG